MSTFKVVILIFCFHIFSTCATTVNCEPPTTPGQTSDWTSIHTNIELKPTNVAITVGVNLPDWQLIYELDNVDYGKFYSTCNGWIDSQFTLLTSDVPVKQSGNDIIFKTNVPGIGISVYDDRGKGIPGFPATRYGYDGINPGAFYIMTVKYWKIPGNIPMNNGIISVTGPEVAGLVGTAGTSSMSSSHADRIIRSSYDYYINSSRILQASLIFQPGTCNIEGGDIRVNMGNFPGNGIASSEWKDASFKLICPEAYGYHGSVDAQANGNYPYQLPPTSKITNNNIPNGRVTISIVPYTEVIDANKGIIALDGTGAQGYGIQLAWGDYSSQNAVEPANPVILNSYVDANTLNSGFRAGDTPIGGNAFTGTDNTIKMAARYIRTTGDTAPGPANAVVQVIANYQ